jgi:hypothetical protein
LLGVEVGCVNDVPGVASVGVVGVASVGVVASVGGAVVSSPSVGVVASVGGAVVFTSGVFPSSPENEEGVAFAKLLLTEPALITHKIVKSKSPRTIRSFNIFL